MPHKQFLQHADIESGFSVLGVDPDLHNVNFVLLGKTPEIDRPQVISYNIKIPAKYKSIAAVSNFLNKIHCLSNIEVNNCAAFVETQDARYTGKTNQANPQDLIHLATMGGALAAVLAQHDVNSVHFIEPKEWKAQTSKDVCQNRICSALGWRYNVGTSKDKMPIPALEPAKNSDGEVIENLYESGNTGCYFASVTLTEKAVSFRLPNIGEWADILDSCGLALHGMKLILDSVAKARKKMEAEKAKEEGK